MRAWVARFVSRIRRWLGSPRLLARVRRLGSGGWLVRVEPERPVGLEIGVDPGLIEGLLQAQAESRESAIRVLADLGRRFADEDVRSAAAFVVGNRRHSRFAIESWLREPPRRLPRQPELLAWVHDVDLAEPSTRAQPWRGGAES